MNIHITAGSYAYNSIVFTFSSVQHRMLDLVIVGASKKGKTSLVKSLNRKLRKHEFSVEFEEISIHNWEYSPPTGDGPDIVFRIWDFPSQVLINQNYILWTCIQ